MQETVGMGDVPLALRGLLYGAGETMKSPPFAASPPEQQGIPTEIEPITRAPIPTKFLVLNDGNEGKVFERTDLGRLIVRDAYDTLWEDYDFGAYEQVHGFLVWEGELLFRPTNWGQLTEDQREEICDDTSALFQSYEDCYVGSWRMATANDLKEMGLIDV